MFLLVTVTNSSPRFRVEGIGGGRHKKKVGSMYL